MITTELKKINAKAVDVRKKAKDAFDKLESDTRSSLDEVKSSLELIQADIKLSISEAKTKIQDYFKSDDFLKIDGEQIQFDAEVRAELKYHAQYSPVEGTDVVNYNQIFWNARKAAAALRQDPERHMSITPVSKQDKWKLQCMVLEATKGEPNKLLEKLDGLEKEISRVDAALNSFDESSEFYNIILN